MITCTINRKSRVSHSYRCNRVRSMFNVEPNVGSEFTLRADLPIDERDWNVGLIVGPSGTGKSSMLSDLFGSHTVHRGFDWPTRPIIDVLGKRAHFDDVAAALSAVGLGSVPSWLRPFDVLSTGEKFRAELARLILDGGDCVCVDEFTSPLDRTVAQVAACAFGKAWRRRAGRFVAATCHDDVTDWLCPDWVYHTGRGEFEWRSLRRRPPIRFTIREENWSSWANFEPHHYLKLGRMACATNFVGYVNGRPVAHVAAGSTVHVTSARLCRLVVMPEWQGAGIGIAFLNHIAERFYRGRSRWNKRLTSLIHTSHPGLSAALRRDKRWVLITSRIGENSDQQTSRGRKRMLAGRNVPSFGGHLRAVVGFRYVGDRT